MKNKSNKKLKWNSEIQVQIIVRSKATVISIVLLKKIEENEFLFKISFFLLVIQLS